MQKPRPIIARIPTVAIFEDDWRARPSSEQPCPIVLIHGTGATKACWAALGADLRTLGYVVFAPDFGERSTKAVAESAAQVGAYIDAVLKVTGAAKVVLVGHSQGGILARYWMRHLGGASKVHQLICLGVPNHGTTPAGYLPDTIRTSNVERGLQQIISDWFGPSGFELLTDSPLIDALNADGDTLPGIHYSCITTKNDAIITPVESCFLSGAHNIYIQDVAKRAIVMHDELPKNKHARQIVISEIVDCPLPPPESVSKPPLALRVQKSLKVLFGRE